VFGQRRAGCALSERPDGGRPAFPLRFSRQEFASSNSVEADVKNPLVQSHFDSDVLALNRFAGYGVAHRGDAPASQSTLMGQNWLPVSVDASTSRNHRPAVLIA
jgi:hypothetical protein